MALNTVRAPSNVGLGSADALTRAEAPGFDDIQTETDAAITYVAKADATGYDDIQTQTAAATDYVAKTEATGYADIQTQTDAAATYMALAAFPLRAQRATLAYTDTTAKTLFTLPIGAIILAFIVNVTTVFNDSGTDLIDIGVDGTPERFVADIDGSSAGIVLKASADEAALGAATAVKGVFTGQNANANAGAMTITALYIVP
jgi:hypothetical protein